MQKKQKSSNLINHFVRVQSKNTKHKQTAHSSLDRRAPFGIHLQKFFCHKFDGYSFEVFHPGIIEWSMKIRDNLWILPLFWSCHPGLSAVGNQLCNWARENLSICNQAWDKSLKCKILAEHNLLARMPLLSAVEASLPPSCTRLPSNQLLPTWPMVRDSAWQTSKECGHQGYARYCTGYTVIHNLLLMPHKHRGLVGPAFYICLCGKRVATRQSRANNPYKL